MPQDRTLHVANATIYALSICLGVATATVSVEARPQSRATNWTGLVYSSNMPTSGTAARALFEGKDSLRSNMPATAKDQFLAAIRLDPTLAEAHFWLAGAYRRLKDGPAARRSLATALRLDPTLAVHTSDLDRFGVEAGRSPATTATGTGGRCDALYSTCMVSATRCSAAGCQTDFGRQAICTGERNQCRARSR